jgi:hypothetical protein
MAPNLKAMDNKVSYRSVRRATHHHSRNKRL